MKSLYEEEAPGILNLIDQGIKQRVELVGPDTTVGVLEFIRSKIKAHKGEYIRIPKIPFDLDDVDSRFLIDLFGSSERQVDFYQHLMDQNWSNRFSEFITEDIEN